MILKIVTAYPPPNTAINVKHAVITTLFVIPLIAPIKGSEMAGVMSNGKIVMITLRN